MSSWLTHHVALALLLTTGCDAVDTLSDAALSTDATLGAVDRASVCGHFGLPCCPLSTCGYGLRCGAGVCQPVLQARCVPAGVLDPAFATTDFPYRPSQSCMDIPVELLDASTPGTFAAPARGVGRMDCEGLPPGPATLSFRARIRSLAADHTLARCACGGVVTDRLTIAVEGQQTLTVEAVGWLLPAEANGPDNSCRAGPDFNASWPVVVPADGRMSLRVDLTDCTSGTLPRRCLFLAGASLDVVPAGDP